MYRQTVPFANSGWKQQKGARRRAPTIARLVSERRRHPKHAQAAVPTTAGKLPRRHRAQLESVSPLEWIGGLWDPHWDYALTVRRGHRRQRYACRYSTLRELYDTVMREDDDDGAAAADDDDTAAAAAAIDGDDASTRQARRREAAKRRRPPTPEEPPEPPPAPAFPSGHWLPIAKRLDSRDDAEARGRDMCAALRGFTAAQLLRLLHHLPSLDPEDDDDGKAKKQRDGGGTRREEEDDDDCEEV